MPAKTLKMNKNDLKIVFFGTPEFAVASLDALVSGGYNVAAVVTMPDKPAGRGKKLSMSAVKEYALAHSLPLLQPERLKDEAFVDALHAIDADLFIVIAFRMLPEVVWTMPRLGTFNLHGSLLPKYRGAAPINRAIMAGETETGVTTFFLKHEIDTGDIISREAIEVGPDEDAGSVHDRLMALGARLTLRTVDDILAGNLHTIPQDELLKGLEPTPAPKIFKDDCHIDWSRTVAEIHNHVRGLAPYPAAWASLTLGGADGEEVSTVKILKTSKAHAYGGKRLSEGQLVLDHGHAYAGTSDGAIELITVQPAGKRPMDAADFLRGLRIGENGRQPFFR